MADNRLWLVHKRTGERVMLAKNFGGYWSTLGDLDEKLNRFFDGDEYINERDDFALDMEHWDERRVRLADNAEEIFTALDTIHRWLVCAPIASAEDMAQSFGEMEQIAARALAKIKEN